MPQLLPFYFVNQLSFTLLGLYLTIYLVSRYILPAFSELFLVRMFIVKMFTHNKAIGLINPQSLDQKKNTFGGSLVTQKP